MLFRLVRPVRRKHSRNPYFVQRIPADLKARLVGVELIFPLGKVTHRVVVRKGATDIRFSLRTSEPSEAKRRHAECAAFMERVFAAHRAMLPVSLDNRQATALAKRIYDGWADERRETTFAVDVMPDVSVRRANLTPEDEMAVWEAMGQYIAELEDADDVKLEATIGPIISRVLLSEGIAEVDEASRARLIFHFRNALKDAVTLRERQARGDYSPDANAQRFPEWEPNAKPAATPSARPRASLKGLVESWWKEAQATGRKPSTYRSYRDAVAKLSAFLKHDDASRVTKQDVIAFKDYRLASVDPRTKRPISPKTVKDSDLSGLKTIFEWAVNNDKLSANPADGVKIKLGKTKKLRSRGFTDEEALSILRASLAYSAKRGDANFERAVRWVPWLCAYTGARVGEMAQLRKQDVRKVGEHWVLRITPEAGTVKTNEARDVVLHPHLIEQGFIKFVESAAGGYLFVNGKSAEEARGSIKGTTNRLASFARTVVHDRNVPPNHGWRHRFKSVGLEAGIDSRILDAIEGHAPRTAGEGYGDVSIKAQAAAIAKLPRYEF